MTVGFLLASAASPRFCRFDGRLEGGGPCVLSRKESARKAAAPSSTATPRGLGAGVFDMKRHSFVRGRGSDRKVGGGSGGRGRARWQRGQVSGAPAMNIRWVTPSTVWVSVPGFGCPHSQTVWQP